jgi:signal transduction histidine kinase
VNIYGRDITDRKRAEEALRQRTSELQQLTETLERRVQERTEELAEANRALRQLSIKLLSAQEEERKRVAGELHDTIGACLSGIKFKVEDTLQRIGKKADVEAKSLRTIVPVIQEAIEECRRIQLDLRPSMLDDLGLLPTLSWFSRRFQTIYSRIHVDQKVTIQESDVPDSLKVVIYRVIQEAMNNCAKHSEASRIYLCLQKIDGTMELVLEDDGQGFDLGKVLGTQSTKRGFGLTTMRERTELSGGSFHMKSMVGKGTIIRARWPI